MKNGQSRDAGKTGHTRHRTKTNDKYKATPKTKNNKSVEIPGAREMYLIRDRKIKN